MIGAKGRDVLYAGDHIFGDVLKSKKLRGKLLSAFPKKKLCFQIEDMGLNLFFLTSRLENFSCCA